MSILKEFRVTLETVTPLFLGGAEPRGEPELRAPSIRGAMRYWLRAILGSFTRDNLAALKIAEAKLFGSAGDKNSAGSAIAIRQRKDQLRKVSFSKLKDGKPGLMYLFFSARKTASGEKERNALEGKFEISISTRQIGENATFSLLRAYSALWLLTHLGGLGSRAHRGAGSLQTVEVLNIPDDLKKYTDILPLEVKATSVDELSAELSKGISFTKRTVSRDLSTGSFASEAQFDILDAETSSIYVVDELFDTWDKALNSLGEAYKNFRLKHSPDLGTIKYAQKSGENLVTPIERSEFGLPIPFFDNMVVRSASYDRRSSPLWFHITKLAGNPSRYAIVLIWFKSIFLPDMLPDSSALESLVLVEENKKEHAGSQSNADLIKTFLYGNDPKSLPWELVEVPL